MAEIAGVAIPVAKPGYEAHLREAPEGIVGPTRPEPGAPQCGLHQELREPHRFVFVGRWESDAVRATHATSAHISACRQKVADWVEHLEIRVVSKIA